MSDLGELGLSSYEEKGYRTLLSLGSATAQEVSEASGVPMGRIYDVLNGLDARDIVRSQSTEPTRYAAVDPETAVDRLLAERRRELDAREARYEALAEGVGPELAATKPAESRFWTAPLGSDAAVSLERDLFAMAGETVRSAMSYPYAAAPWDRYEPEVAPFYEVVDSGVDVRLLGHAAMLEAAPPAAVERVADAPANVSVRVTTDLETTFDIVDGNEVTFHVPHPTDRGDRLGVIHVRDGSMAGRLVDVFDRTWEAATPLSAVAEDESPVGE
jgi:sugar-specific transcriptional regulator TrmB